MRAPCGPTRSVADTPRDEATGSDRKTSCTDWRSRRAAESRSPLIEDGPRDEEAAALAGVSALMAPRHLNC